MTDLEKIKKTFKEIGLDFTLKDKKDYRGENVSIDFDKYIRVEHGIGYPSFWGELYFLNEKFVCHGLWE